MYGIFTYVHLNSYTININQMWGNISYMDPYDPMGKKHDLSRVEKVKL